MSYSSISLFILSFNLSFIRSFVAAFTLLFLCSFVNLVQINSFSILVQIARAFFINTFQISFCWRKDANKENICKNCSNLNCLIRLDFHPKMPHYLGKCQVLPIVTTGCNLVFTGASVHYTVQCRYRWNFPNIVRGLNWKWVTAANLLLIILLCLQE